MKKKGSPEEQPILVKFESEQQRLRSLENWVSKTEVIGPPITEHYYPFGRGMMDRKRSLGGYGYGFNGQEKSDQVHTGIYTALFWEYDGRIGRRWNIDPKRKAGTSGSLNTKQQPKPANNLEGTPGTNTPAAVFDENEKKSGYFWGNPAGDIMPDFIQASGSFTLPFGFTSTASFTVARNGIIYFGLGGPKGAGYALTINWLNHRYGTKDQLDNFLSGWGKSASAGYWGGLQYSWSSDPNNKTTATGVGLVSPGGGVGESYNFTLTNKFIKW